MKCPFNQCEVTLRDDEHSQKIILIFVASQSTNEGKALSSQDKYLSVSLRRTLWRTTCSIMEAAAAAV